MNAARFLAVAALALAVSACASMPRSEVAAQPKLQSFEEGYDRAYMNEVERRSARLGVSVKWVNPPRAPKTAPGG